MLDQSKPEVGKNETSFQIGPSGERLRVGRGGRGVDQGELDL